MEKWQCSACGRIFDTDGSWTEEIKDHGREHEKMMQGCIWRILKDGELYGIASGVPANQDPSIGQDTS